MAFEAADPVKPGRRGRLDRKPYSRSDIMKASSASGSNEFGSFIQRFAHQPRATGLFRTPSGSTVILGGNVNPGTTSQANLFPAEVSSQLPNEAHISNMATPAISRSMSVSEVLDILVQHGCQDMTQDIALASCSEYPIATGGFGDIYRGQLTSGIRVAIKCTRVVLSSITHKEQQHLACAARELHTWSKLNHRYILKLLGLAQYRGQIAMVSPWVQRGPLSRYLEDHPQLNRPQLCRKIADGLSFLHLNQIVHGDLKGANILVSDSEEPLIVDFGNAVVYERTLQFTHSEAKFNISPRWTAPELLGEGAYTMQSDVYALGMTILEVITGTVPYPNLKDVAVLLAVTQNQHPTRPQQYIPSASTEGDTLWELLVSCWASDPTARPTASGVRDTMENITPEGLVYYHLLAPSSPVGE